MRPSLRFLAVALVGWAGVRAAAVGMLPGTEIFSIERSEAKAPPPIAATEFPPIDPVAPAPQFLAAEAPYAPQPQLLASRVQPIAVPVYYASAPAPAPASHPPRLTPILPEPTPAFYSRVPPLDEWPLSRIAATSLPPMRSSVVVPGQSTPVVNPKRIDRVQLTTWAMLRGRQGQLLGPSSLASGGTLGGSQAGARLAYNVTPAIAATLRTTSDVGRRGAEVAAGVRVRPVASIPVWLTAERRQRLGRYGSGRNAFAFFAEGGLFQRPVGLRFQLDGYLQGGIVGLRRRDAFVDGAMTLTRPLYRQFSGGVGVWGGAQPGVYRVDAGPRVSMKVRSNLQVHVDWRQRVAGNAQPGSGTALTVAGDF